LPSQHGQIDICGRSINRECRSNPALLDSMKTLPQILSESGYNCHAIGKFHLSGKGPGYNVLVRRELESWGLGLAV
jgi:arylsulfatase A-like enzyme